MRKILIIVMAILMCVCGLTYAANKQLTITLNDDQQDAWENILDTNESGLEAAMQQYVVNVAESHITQRMQEELDAMTKEEIRDLLPNFKVKKVK